MARTLDLLLLIAVIEAATGAVSATFWLVLPILAANIPIEAALLMLFGSTPGKAVLGLRVRAVPGPLVAIQRSFLAWLLGLGGGLLIPFTYWFAYERLLDGKLTLWDEISGTTVIGRS